MPPVAPYTSPNNWGLFVIGHKVWSRFSNGALATNKQKCQDLLNSFYNYGTLPNRDYILTQHSASCAPKMRYNYSIENNCCVSYSANDIKQLIKVLEL